MDEKSARKIAKVLVTMWCSNRICFKQTACEKRKYKLKFFDSYFDMYSLLSPIHFKLKFIHILWRHSKKQHILIYMILMDFLASEKSDTHSNTPYEKDGKRSVFYRIPRINIRFHFKRQFFFSVFVIIVFWFNRTQSNCISSYPNRTLNHIMLI